jgi:hypothetical protein
VHIASKAAMGESGTDATAGRHDASGHGAMKDRRCSLVRRETLDFASTDITLWHRGRGRRKTRATAEEERTRCRALLRHPLQLAMHEGSEVETGAQACRGVPHLCGTLRTACHAGFHGEARGARHWATYTP